MPLCRGWKCNHLQHVTAFKAYTCHGDIHGIRVQNGGMHGWCVFVAISCAVNCYRELGKGSKVGKILL